MPVPSPIKWPLYVSMTDNNLNRLSELTRVPRDEIRAIWERVKANRKRLESCDGPHDFSRRYKRGASTRYQCIKCKGNVDHNQKIWYELGIAHAMKK